MLKIDPSVEIWPPEFYPMSIINGIELNQTTFYSSNIELCIWAFVIEKLTMSTG